MYGHVNTQSVLVHTYMPLINFATIPNKYETATYYLPHISFEGHPVHPEQQDLPALMSFAFLYIIKPV